jgi:hypothetical protein
MTTLEEALSRIVELEKLVEKLKEENKTLRTILEERVSAPRVSFKKPGHSHTDKEHKKPGRPEGHEGAYRPMPEKVDEVKEAKLEGNICPECEHRTAHLGYRKRITEDIIPAKVKVTEFWIHQYFCRHCNRMVEAPVTDAFPNCRFGLALYLHVVFLKKKVRIPYGQIKILLKAIYGLDISEAELHKMNIRLALEFKDKYIDLIKELQQSPFVNADETGWPVNGKHHYLWGFIAKGIAIYHIDKTRSQKVAKRFLGEDFRGVLITDFYSAYTGFTCPKQKCLVHLFRELKETAADKSENSSFHQFRREVEEIVHGAIEYAGKEEDVIERGKMKYKYENMIDGIIQKRWKDGDAKRLTKRLKSHKESLFTFLLYPNIEYHNNIAERGLRSNVVIRKISYGSKSEIGATSHSVLMSVIETCNMRDQNFLEWGHEYIENRLH